jgi:hypothetical protein
LVSEQLQKKDKRPSRQARKKPQKGLIQAQERRYYIFLRYFLLKNFTIIKYKWESKKRLKEQATSSNRQDQELC